MNSEGTPLPLDRLKLIQTLNSLPDSQFKELVFALNPPPGLFPASLESEGERSDKLLGWAEDPDVGPGLSKVQEVLSEIIGKTTELSDSPSNASFTEDLGNGVTLEMIYLPEGRFWMGSLENEEGREGHEILRHLVSVPAFFMGKYAVTQRQWHSVSLFDEVDRKLTPDPSCFKGGSRPVESVTWYEVVEFCARLSKHAGKDYRLPSEAEWEYACRAGTTTPFHFGETLSTELANYQVHYGGTTEVGKFLANAFGLYDMHGNVYEWCLEYGKDDYMGASTGGSVRLSSGKSSYRIIRGGSWYNKSRHCRCASRDGNYPDYRSPRNGFRVRCSAPRTP